MRRRTLSRHCPGLVQLALVALLASGATFQAAAAADRADAFTILHLTDTHLCRLDGYDARLVRKREHFGHGYEPFRQLLNTVPARVVADAIVITGDMIDFHEGEAADGTLRAGQIEPLAALLQPVKVPLWMALGNHDIQTHVSSPDQVTRNGGRAASNPRAQKARAAWIRQCDCFHEGTYYAREVQVGRTRWTLCFLDNAYQVTGGPARSTYWDLPQLEWLDNELARSPGHKAILFFHIPLGPDPSMDGADGPRGIYGVLDRHPCVVAAFCGHGHKNLVFDRISLPAGHAITQVETAAFGYDRNAWRTITLGEDAVTVSEPGGTGTELVIGAAAPRAVPVAR